MNILITRHPGAKQWVDDQGIEVDVVIDHFDPAEFKINAGDKIIGILPMPLAAHVCEQVAEFHWLSVNVPLEMRGQELTAEKMQELGATIEQYEIKRVPNE